MDSYDDFQSTPTGKVSKAKKGKPVHVCSECQKVYTRAEHLRRHQSSHQEPQFECPVCQRRFHRKDLLERHYKRLRGTSTSISVGSTIEDRAANMWSLPIALISRHSPYMEAMSPGSGIFPKAHINLPDDDPAVFGLFVEWLYYGTYNDFTSPSSSNIHARCWGLGDKLLCNEFKNYAMGRLYKQHMEFSMACEDVEYAYANTSLASKLRQFYMILSNKPSQTQRNCVDLLEIVMQFAEGSRPSHLITLEHPTKFILQVSPQIPERIYGFRRSQLHSDYTISYRIYEIVSQTEEEEQEKDVNGQHKEAESRDSSVEALSLKQESPGGNEYEPVQASVSGDDNKPVCLSLEKATTSLQTAEGKEYTEG
ncbi:hypothetical protein DER44DRAFT_903238 [Fusarium oxysporum]|nr:hypothetical protein DER44DRAFT_903238 [Fusarium oxysporum]